MFINQKEYFKIIEAIPILCVDLLIVHKGKCLLMRRDNEPAKGQYWFPGGRINKMEKIKDAALRKAEEEVNLKCLFQRIISVEETMFEKERQMHTDIHTVNICCHLTTESVKHIKIDKYHDEYMWVTYENLENINLHPAVTRPLMNLFNQTVNHLL